MESGEDRVNYWTIPEIKENPSMLVDNKLRFIHTTKIQKLIKIVCDEYKLPVSLILEPSRKSPRPEMRNMICYFALRVIDVGLSAEGISKWIYVNSRGNHSNVFNGAKRTSFLLDSKDQSVTAHYTNILCEVKRKFPHLFINN